MWCLAFGGVCSRGSQPSRRCTLPAAFTGVRHTCPGIVPSLGACGRALLAALAWEFGSVVGLKPHLKMLRNVLASGKFIWNPHNCPALTFIVCLAEAGRNQGGGESLEDGKGGGERGTPGDPRFCQPSSLSPSLPPSSLPSCNIKNFFRWGSWVAQSVKGLTSARVMILQFVSSSPVSGSALTAQSLEPASDSGSPPLSLSLPHSHSVSQKKNVKNFTKFFKC